ncbi:MAG: symmetrical bis(5'-nucleosyl)-tetraphosphatase [Pseudomonadota bacterium]
MAFYAVGDIQGCYTPLARLLDKVNFDPANDKLCCVGDLVNRGPESLETLRFLQQLGDSCDVVLGNHDIHFLAMFYGIRTPKHGDTLNKLLEAEDADKHVKWLRKKPLMIKYEKRKLVLCHAGVYPWWDLDLAARCARDVESTFANKKKCIKLLSKIYSNQPSKWDKDLGETRKKRFTINAFTRMRFCSPKGHLNLTESGFAGRGRKNRVPWFDIKNPGRKGYKVVFGHWSALGIMDRADALCLDTGYVWGRKMTMAKLPKQPDDNVRLYQQAWVK